MYWAPTHEWWTHKLLEVTSVANKPGALLEFKDFCVAVEVLSRFALRQASKLRHTVASDIVNSCLLKARARAARAISIIEAQKQALRLAERRQLRQREKLE